MGEFATNAKANAALTTGIIGTSGVGLGLLNGLLGGGGLLGGAPRCAEDHCINRYEFGLEKENAAKDSEIALLKANIYGDQKSLELYKYIDGELREIRTTLGTQAVLNQKTADSFEMVHSDLCCVKNELYSAIARERDERCCSDNALLNYANGTFYPKLVAGVTPTTETTAQTLYNPLPNCGGCCGK
jgi:hypothetical protein